ncbi:hypothetical protein [Sphingobium sp. AP50]|nr:hypothetical protein [Sphingobium sp. AP50]
MRNMFRRVMRLDILKGGSPGWLPRIPYLTAICKPVRLIAAEMAPFEIAF